MFKGLLIFLTLQFSLSAMAAQKPDHWYKVESKTEGKKTKDKIEYPYDSVEKDSKMKVFREVGFWSLRPKVGIAGGFHADNAVFKEGKTNRLFLNSSLQFRTRPWHRITANALLLQNNSMFVGAAWEMTPSRERFRSYYGAGVAHRLVSEKQFSNLVELESYYLTLQYGWEFLLKSQNGWNIELKTFLSGNNKALQLSVGYIIPL